ncbi:fimbrillin family protein, partial [Bacteroides sp. OttesenSCG-928-E20]|nr:fimbrillin family protein [Bacteroides sp. OttesenSCG-928-E20]
MKNTGLTLRIGFAISLFLLPIIFLSCVNEIKDSHEQDDDSLVRVHLSARIQQLSTRATKNEFSDDDSIGLFVVNSQSGLGENRDVDNAKFTYTSLEGFESDKPVYYPRTNTSVDFISYYPYRENAIKEGETGMLITTETNQEQEEKFRNSDFMVAESYGITPSESPISLIFKHKLCLLNIHIKASDKYTIDELFDYNPQIKIKDVFTKAIYNFPDGKFTNLNTLSDIVPHINWEKDNEKLVGASTIIIPQIIAAETPFIELYINDSYYGIEFAKPFNLGSGYAKEITATLTPNEAETKCVLDVDIQEWAEDEKPEVVAKEHTAHIDVSALTFKNSNVYRVYNKGVQVAEICKEYLFAEDVINAEAIVAYPMLEGKVNLKKGFVLEIVGNAQKVHAGRIQWDVATNQFVYQAGTSSPVKYIYISNNGDILTRYQEDALQLQVKPDVLVDTRGIETISYPIVKIGTQYWMKGNLKATYYTDGEPIAQGNGFSDASAKYGKTTYYYFYNSAAIATGKLAPEGWRISSSTDWESLITYVNEETAALKNGSSWKNSDLCPVTNMTGFNAVATGIFNSDEHKKLSNNEPFTSYWATFTKNPKAVEKTFYISGSSNVFQRGGNSETLGVPI